MLDKEQQRNAALVADVAARDEETEDTKAKTTELQQQITQLRSGFEQPLADKEAHLGQVS
eukprot:6225266-Karenia_brevis.AAC.1